MQRVRNWDAALVAWAEGMVGRAFVWGSTDCVSLARGAARAMYGRELAPSLAPWKTPRGLMGRVKTKGGVEGWLRSVADPYGPRFARSGDLVLLADPCPSTQLPSLAVVVTRKLLVTRVDDQVRLEPFARLPATAQVWRLR